MTLKIARGARYAHVTSSEQIEHLVQTVYGAQDPDRNWLDGLTISEVMAHFHVPGISVAVISSTALQWSRAWGLADIRCGRMSTTETMFQAASISKAVSAIATLRAVCDGRFGLDQDINSILNSWTFPSENYTITPRMLLSHTSGLGDGLGFPGYAGGVPLPTIQQILDGVPPANTGPVRLEWEPLNSFKYSGGGSLIQQLALSDALNTSFPQIMSNSVFTPLGMHMSTFEQPLSPEKDALAARGHDLNGQPMGDRWRVYPELSAAGLWTTPTDLAKLLIEMQGSLNGKTSGVLDRQRMQEAVTPSGIGPYGCGFEIERKGEGWYFGHSGGNAGFRCRMIAHRVKGYGAVVMTNADRGIAVVDEVISRIERAYEWDSLDKPIISRNAF